MAGGIGKEIPWCTIILVVGALTCHSLVLMGNLNTAAMFTKLGHSTKGWSHVGQKLGDSLTEDVDYVMGEVSTHLTQVISEIVEVKAAIDNGIALIGGSTDSALAQVNNKTAAAAYRSLALAASSKEGWPGPKAQPQMLLQNAILAKGDQPLAPVVLPAAVISSAEDGAIWMMETFRMTHRQSHHHGDKGKMSENATKSLATAQLPKGPSSVFDNIKDPSTPAGYKSDMEVLKWCFANPGKVQPALETYLKNHFAEASHLVKAAGKNVTEQTVAHVDSIVSYLIGTVNKQIHAFLEKIKPALLQIGKWLSSFGTKVQATIDGFSTTLDKAQKTFDEIMKQLTHPGGVEKMLHETYNLFDASNTGSISVSDLKDVGDVYGITALKGSKAAEMLSKYDSDHSGALDKKEFALFTADAAIPGAMAVVLRAYAKKLAQISGQVAKARQRDEVASAVVSYLELVCVKNMTKVGWISGFLTDGSLPMEFTADILRNIAMSVDNPAKLMSVEPGPILVKTMLEINQDYVTKTVTMMSDPKFWSSEGFDPKDHPIAIKRITKWIADAAKTVKHGPASLLSVHSKLHALFSGTTASHASTDATAFESMPAMAAQMVAERSRRHMATQRAYRAQAHAALLSSQSSRVLFQELYGGATAGSTVEDPEAHAAMKSGIAAHPETLKFAKQLAANSSATAKRLQHLCFEYTGSSSSTLDAFATQIQAMIKKTQNFLNMMMQYSTPEGINRMEEMVMHFVENAEVKVKKVITEKVYQAEKRLVDSSFDVSHALSTKHITNVMKKADPGVIFVTVKKTLDQLQAVLPEVINDVKFAKKEVSSVSKQLESIFSTFETKGPPIFDLACQLYGTMWTAYYVLFATITVGILFYGFWASGWFGGPGSAEASEGEDYQAPSGFMDRCRMCCSACTTCMSACHDNKMTFWSCIILSEVIVLLLFVVALVLTLLSGIKAFMGAGCSSIYFLSDPHICTGILAVVKGWLGSFWEGAATQLANACDSESLLTCMLIQEKLMQSVIWTTAGGMGAAVMSFQMIVNTAQMHEQVRWRKLADTFNKES